MSYFAAIDLGATSGRTILASLDREYTLSIEEINRFPNTLVHIDGHAYWNIYTILDNIKDGLSKIARRGIELKSIGIDSWGVDFAFIADDGSVIGLPRAYRDPQFIGAAERFTSNVMSDDELYKRTGIQQLDFNTVFQLHELKDSFAMKSADKIAFIPDLLTYLLTGRLVTEYTIASTSSLLNPFERNFDSEILDSLNITAEKFGPLVQPPTQIGVLKSSVCNETGISPVPVIAVAGHDTASAVAATPATSSGFAYISSGTWSLIGIESPKPVINDISLTNNITNEGGVENTVRLLKNMTGMWIVEQCLASWKKAGYNYSYSEMVAMADTAPEFRAFIDPDDISFKCPDDMPEAIRDYCIRTKQHIPVTHAEIIRMIFESLALKCNYVLKLLDGIADGTITKLHIIGGGSRNKLLNQFIANAVSLPVIAGPAEATAIGNIMMQAKACGLVASLSEMRHIIADNVDVEIFCPTDEDKWQKAFIHFRQATNL